MNKNIINDNDNMNIEMKDINNDNHLNKKTSWNNGNNNNNSNKINNPYPNNFQINETNVNFFERRGKKSQTNIRYHPYHHYSDKTTFYDKII